MHFYEFLFFNALEILTEVSQFKGFFVDITIKKFFNDISRINCFSSKVETSAEAYFKC